MVQVHREGDEASRFAADAEGLSIEHLLSEPTPAHGVVELVVFGLDPTVTV